MDYGKRRRWIDFYQIRMEGLSYEAIGKLSGLSREQARQLAWQGARIIYLGWSRGELMALLNDPERGARSRSSARETGRRFPIELFGKQGVPRHADQVSLEGGIGEYMRILRRSKSMP